MVFSPGEHRVRHLDAVYLPRPAHRLNQEFEPDPATEPHVSNNGTWCDRHRFHRRGHRAPVRAIEHHRDKPSAKATRPTQLSGKTRQHAAPHVHIAPLIQFAIYC